METCLSKYGETHPNKTEELKKKISKSRIENNSQEIAVKTIIEKYGDLETYYRMCSEKAYETRKENGTLCSRESGPEKELYKMLCEKFGEDDIIKQYREKRYPFKCDFYIKSEDLFIELNGHIAHMYHPFDETNEDDIKTLSYLKSKNSDFYNAIIYTWTDLDVRKLETAKKNNLNYWQIYWYKDKDIVYSQLKN